MRESESIREIRRGNVSKRRNPLIADLFRRIQMVETWGRGMRLILTEEPTVQFSEVAQIFIAAFFRPSYAESEKTINKIINETIDKGTRPAQETPKKHQRNTKEMIIEAIRMRPEITMKELAAQLDLTIDSIRHHMRLLQNAGVIRHLGSTKAGRWEVKG